MDLLILNKQIWMNLCFPYSEQFGSALSAAQLSCDTGVSSYGNAIKIMLPRGASSGEALERVSNWEWNWLTRRPRFNLPASVGARQCARIFRSCLNIYYSKAGSLSLALECTRPGPDQPENSNYRPSKILESRQCNKQQGAKRAENFSKKVKKEKFSEK